MIALTAKLRESGDLPQAGQFDRTWGQVPISPADIRAGIVPFDPESCPTVVDAFSDAGLEPPMVYRNGCS